MQERDRPDGSPSGRRPGEGDIRGPTRGDFSDWDNPEDDLEDAPEGYYDEDPDEEGYIPTPDDPDYDLSEEAGYSGWEDRGRRPMLPPWLVLAVSLLLILALLVPLLIRFS